MVLSAPPDHIWRGSVGMAANELTSPLCPAKTRTASVDQCQTESVDIDKIDSRDEAVGVAANTANPIIGC